MSEVLFVVMPFAGLDHPQIGVSLLKSQLRCRGIPASVLYLNIPFAAAISREAYELVSHVGPLAGEWLFSHALFRHTSQADNEYISKILLRRYSCTQDVVDRMCRIAGMVEAYVDHCLQAVEWERYPIIGFTSTFEQNASCLALAKRLKQRYPGKTIVMGGANCHDVMGLQLHKSFPFLDYVFTGDADFSFPELAVRLSAAKPERDGVSGYVRREAAQSCATPAVPVKRLDALPYPDYDDYFAALRATPLRQPVTPYLPMETARGCWWGARHHCTFCGLYREGLEFRSKSPPRVLDELVYLANRYGTANIIFSDNLIDMDYFGSLLPELKRRKPGISLAWETKANLRKEQLELLADAGVTIVGPGIESFSGHVLHLMHKGVSPLQNIQLLKWCRQFRLDPSWFLLYGIPGETSSDYEEIYRNAEHLSHLTPPAAVIPTQLERFSPYFEWPAENGIRNVRAQMSYNYIYPFEQPVLDNLAWLFDFDFDGQSELQERAAPLHSLFARWKAVHNVARLEVSWRTPDLMTIVDTRPDAVHPVYYFGPRQAAVIDACDSIQTIPQIVRRLEIRFRDSAPEDSWTAQFLHDLKGCGLVLEDGGRYLSLVVQPRSALAAAAETN